MAAQELSPACKSFDHLLGSAEKLDRFRPQENDPFRRTLALVLAGGRGDRLQPLTARQCKPAVPFGGSWRIIDFTLSNCFNSGLRQIGILVQYKSRTLLDHLQRGWNVFNRECNEFIELLPPANPLSAGGYEGTADAVCQNLSTIAMHEPDYVLVLAGDHVYKADYRRLIEYHIDSGAVATIGTVEVPRENAGQFGILDVNDRGCVSAFREKPSRDECLKLGASRVLASMGIYVFNRDVLTAVLQRDAENPHSRHDFGHDILPMLIKGSNVQAYPYFRAQRDHYWRDVGTLDAYYEAHLDLIRTEPAIDLYDPDWPIRSFQPQLPPARFVHDDQHRLGTAANSMVAAGCVVSGARVRRSVLFTGVTVEEQSRVDSSLLLPHVRVGKRCRIRNAIIEEGTVIPDGTRIGYDQSQDRLRYELTGQGRVMVCEKDLHGRHRRISRQGAKSPPTARA